MPQGPGLRRLLLVFGITVLFVALLKVLGMLLGTALFLLAVLRGVERHAWPSALGIAVATAVVNYLVFARWLQVPFRSVCSGSEMDLLHNLAMGFSIALTPFNLTLAFVGVTLGTLIGALPGIGPVSGVALLLPLTFGMHPTSGIIMLAALYYGTMYGGTITSVLINTPGESSSVVTCIDGHQMALRDARGPRSACPPSARSWRARSGSCS